MVCLLGTAGRTPPARSPVWAGGGGPKPPAPGLGTKNLLPPEGRKRSRSAGPRGLAGGPGHVPGV